MSLLWFFHAEPSLQNLCLPKLHTSVTYRYYIRTDEIALLEKC